LPLGLKVFVNHKNGKTECLTKQEGWNSAIFSGDLKYFINTWSNATTPYTFNLCDARGKVISTLLDNKQLAAKYKQEGLSAPEFFSFTTNDGVKLDGWMVKPANFSASKKYPVIMFQYSGPGSQQVVNSWGIGSMGQGALFDRYLAQEGFGLKVVKIGENGATLDDVLVHDAHAEDHTLGCSHKFRGSLHVHEDAASGVGDRLYLLGDDRGAVQVSAVTATNHRYNRHNTKAMLYGFRNLQLSLIAVVVLGAVGEVEGSRCYLVAVI